MADNSGTNAATVARATAAQEQAAADRIAATGIDPANPGAVQDTAGHGEDGPAVDVAQPQGEPQPQRAEPQAETPRHDPRPNARREEIAKQIAAQRRQADEPEADQDAAARLAQDELPPFLQPEPPRLEEPAPPLVPEQPQETQPPLENPPADAKYVIKVRGKEMEVTQAELIALAQKNAAGDSYFEDARTAADEARRALAEIRAERARLDPATHPGGPNGTQPAAEPTPPPEPEHPGADLAAVIEKMQLGSPEEAAAEFEKALQARLDRVRAEIAPTARTVSVNDRTQTEINQTARERAEFERANADLVTDKYFRAAMEVELYDQQLADLRAIGMDEAKMQEQLKRQPSLADLARYHQLARVNNLGVRPVKSLLEDSKKVVLGAKAFAPPPSSQTTQPTEPKQPVAPKIEVRVDRSANRQALRPQPTRTGAPAAVTPVPQQRDIADVRSDAIAKEIAARNRVRGMTARG